MNYKTIDNLIVNTIDKIFEGLPLIEMYDKDKALMIYEYLAKTTAYDWPLLEQRQKRGRVDLRQEMMNVFEKNNGICSSLSQVYKLLLEKVNINSRAVICNDGNPVLHQLLVVENKDDNSWYFSDITRGIIYKEEGLDNFSYGLDRCPSINQTMMGTLPESLYDAVLGRDIERNEDGIKTNEFYLYDLPGNIISETQVK